MSRVVVHRRLVALVIVALILAGIPVYLSVHGTKLTSATADCERPIQLLPPMAAGATTHQGFGFSEEVTTVPTAGETQDKLWYNDGAWWGVMVDPTENSLGIFELLADHSWRRTEALVDERPESTADVSWDGRHLYVVTVHPRLPLRVSRFSYSSSDRQYQLDTGFPVNVTGHGTVTGNIEHDSAGRLWITYVHGRLVWVAHSAGDQLTWVPPFVPPVPGTETATSDVASLVAFNGHIGLMWSNQATDAFYFAVHEDAAPTDEWSLEVPLSGAGMVDDHINVKSDSAGRVYAVVKTSQGDAGEPADSPLTVVLARAVSGSWSQHVFGTVADAHTRHITIVDQDNEELYVLATKGGSIVYKSAPLHSLEFVPGAGTPFASFPGVWLADPGSSSHPVNSESGIVVIATSAEDRRYYHGELPLSGDGPQPTGAAELGTPISFKAASTGVIKEGTSLTISAPNGPAAGDVLLASVDARGDAAVAPPPGWELVRADVNRSGLKKVTFVRTATAAEPGSYSWRLSPGSAAAGVILAYAGIDQAHPIQSATGNVSSGLPHVSAPAAPVLTAGARVVGLFAAAAPAVLTMPPNLAGRAVADVPGHGATAIASRAGDATCSGTGTTGDITAEASSAVQSVGQLVVLAPDPRVGEELTSAPPQTIINRTPSTSVAQTPDAGAPPEIAFRAASGSANDGGAHLVVERPASVAAGEIMLVSIDTRGAPDITPPFGWTLIRVDESGDVIRKATYFRIAEEAEPGWYTWYFSRPASAAGLLVSYAGVDQEHPVDSAAGRASATASSTVDAPPVVIASEDRTLVGFFAIAALTPVSPPREMDRRVAVDTPAAHHDLSSVAADMLGRQRGEVSGLAAAADRQGMGIGHLIVLRPAR